MGCSITVSVVRTLAGILTALTLGGCIAIPIPVPEDKVLAGEQIRPEDVAFIEDGVTYLYAIEGRIGPPDYFWVNHQVMIYDWTMRNAVFLWAAPGGVGGVDDAPKGYLLLIQVDDRKRVLRHEIVVISPFQTTRRRTELWLAKPWGERPG